MSSSPFFSLLLQPSAAFWDCWPLWQLPTRSISEVACPVRPFFPFFCSLLGLLVTMVSSLRGPPLRLHVQFALFSFFCSRLQPPALAAAPRDAATGLRRSCRPKLISKASFSLFTVCQRRKRSACAPWARLSEGRRCGQHGIVLSCNQFVPFVGFLLKATYAEKSHICFSLVDIKQRSLVHPLCVLICAVDIVLTN